MNRAAFHNITVEFNFNEGEDPTERLNEMIRHLNTQNITVVTTPMRYRSQHPVEKDSPTAPPIPDHSA